MVGKFHAMYWPDRERVGVRSPRGSIYCRKNFSLMSTFIEDQNEKIPDFAVVGLIWNKESFLRIERNVGVPTVQLGQANGG